MKVELQCGDKITIPEGCKAIVKDGCIEIEKVQDFKDGDILVVTENGRRYNVFIYKNTDEYSFHSFYIGVNTENSIIISKFPEQRWCNDDLLDYATDKEKQLLFDKMKEKGLQWNAEEKRVEKRRWKAKEGDKYHYVFSTLEVNDTTYHDYDAHRLRAENYNCFRTQEQAKEAARQVKETLQKYHEEIGE